MFFLYELYLCNQQFDKGKNFLYKRSSANTRRGDIIISQSWGNWWIGAIIIKDSWHHEKQNRHLDVLCLPRRVQSTTCDFLGPKQQILTQVKTPGPTTSLQETRGTEGRTEWLCRMQRAKSELEETLQDKWYASLKKKKNCKNNNKRWRGT